MTVQRDDAFMLLLGALIQNAGQVQAVAGCTLRRGLATIDVHGLSNRDNLLCELDDLKGAIQRIERALLPVAKPVHAGRVTYQMSCPCGFTWETQIGRICPECDAPRAWVDGTVLDPPKGAGNGR